MKTKLITLWHKWNNKTKQFEYNHYSEGFDSSAFPLAESAEQSKSWAGCRWCKERAVMKDSVITHAE